MEAIMYYSILQGNQLQEIVASGPIRGHDSDHYSSIPGRQSWGASLLLPYYVPFSSAFPELENCEYPVGYKGAFLIATN
jgi:hypothetical protein